MSLTYAVLSLRADNHELTYYFRRETIIPAGKLPGMAFWRKSTFSAMHRNSHRNAAYYGVPAIQVVEVDAHLGVLGVSGFGPVHRYQQDAWADGFHQNGFCGLRPSAWLQGGIGTVLDAVLLQDRLLDRAAHDLALGIAGQLGKHQESAGMLVTREFRQ